VRRESLSLGIEFEKITFIVAKIRNFLAIGTHWYKGRRHIVGYPLDSGSPMGYVASALESTRKSAACLSWSWRSGSSTEGAAVHSTLGFWAIFVPL